jgi:Ca2+/Na+ antiporter
MFVKNVFIHHLDHPPNWRPLFAFLGFVVAVIWIYALANEIVALLKVFGVALGFSDAILGLTLLAWGNSISDLVSNIDNTSLDFSVCFENFFLVGVYVHVYYICNNNKG